MRYNHGHHISGVHFRTHFGREHSFRINRPVIVEGRPRFVFGGVAFGIVGPWPRAWYYTDAVYVENIDGDYFLCNTANPGRAYTDRRGVPITQIPKLEATA